MSPPARSIMNLEEGGKMFFNHPNAYIFSKVTEPEF